MCLNTYTMSISLLSLVQFWAIPAWAQTVDEAAGSATTAEPAEGEDATPADSDTSSLGTEDGANTPASSSEESSDAAAGTYNLKLRAIEERVNELKERIFQSKARLIQLQEVVLHGTITGSQATLIHRNEMGSSFRLRRVQYALDGAPIFNRVATGDDSLDDDEELQVFSGAIAPGNHQLSVYLEYNGHGFGIFSYLKGYTFKIKSSYTFTAEEGKHTTVRIVGFEKGGLTAKLQDRPSVRYDTEVSRQLRSASGVGSPESDDAQPEAQEE